jgi:O-antigen ligase
VLVGLPFGSGWERTLPSGHTIESHISPHNFYLETFLRTGAIGLLLMLALYYLALRASARRGPAPDDGQLLSPSVLFVVIAVQLLYYITYTPDTAQAMLFGLGCAAVLRLQRDPRASGEAVHDGGEQPESVQRFRALDGATER